jgi:S1-C subfamily serine protease
MLLAAFPAWAQKRPLGFAEASSQFEALSAEQRIRLQVLLTASGYWPAVPNVKFSGRLFEAIKKFQQVNGYYPNGRLDARQLSHLIDAAAPLLAHWGFREVTHPFRDARIWVPFGLGLRATRTKEGWEYKDSTSRVYLSFVYFDGTTVEQGFERTVRNMIAQGTAIHYKILKGDFMAVSATTASGIDIYIRYHNNGYGSVGFILTWRSDEARDLHIERVATLISASLWASQTGAIFITPPGQSSEPESARAPEPAPAPSAPAASSAAAPKSEEAVDDNEDVKGPSSGTGFFVSTDGHVLTNSHVVEACTKGLLVSVEGQQPSSAYLVKADTTNDLALLKTSISPAHVASFRMGVRLGEGIAVFGYPMAGVLSTSGNFTLGNITALTGLGDDSRHVQISAPVQGGNSGGPLIGEAGNVVGVVVAKLNALKVMVATKGEIPQNVNFAIKTSVALAFLESNGISPAVVSASESKLNPADLADRAKAMSVFIVCDR